MKELSLNILDIAQNSVKAKASLIEIEIDETDEKLTIIIRDNGCGISKEILEGVTNPFYTTRTTRNVGLGIPLLKDACEQTGGSFEIKSQQKNEENLISGTEVRASFFKNHLDFTPLGDTVSTVTTLIQGSPDIDFIFSHNKCGSKVFLSTLEMREVLGEIPLNSFEVIKWAGDCLKEQYQDIVK
ncbi:MAG: ATP-binding protein [Oscillospiraceae bacterium]|nr:ATP-binding protein [Oscillospiraceae bacterium]